MALPINVSDLINRRVIESARIEYKGDWNPEPILHSICAFANDIDNWGGGYIIIGIEEELASELGYTKVTSTLSKALKELMAEGIVQYSEPEKVRSRNQKLYLVKEHGDE